MNQEERGAASSSHTEANRVNIIATPSDTATDDRSDEGISPFAFTFQGWTVGEVRQREPGVGEVSAFRRVENLVWIKQNTLYHETLQDKERSLKLLTDRVDRREKRVEDLTNQVFNLVGFFCVFQGVILTAVAQLSSTVTTQLDVQQGGTRGRPLCGKVWPPVCLSVLAAIVSIVSVLLKFKHLYSLDESIHEEKSSQTAATATIESLLRDGADFKFCSLQENRIKRKPTTLWILKCIAVIGALLTFTALLCEMVTTKLINCHEGIVHIQEANAGICRGIAELEHKDEWQLTLNDNATYREFVCLRKITEESATDIATAKIVLTSDDCVENAVIMIYSKPETHQFTWQPVEKRKQNALADARLIGGLKTQLNGLKRNLQASWGGLLWASPMNLEAPK